MPAHAATLCWRCRKRRCRAESSMLRRHTPACARAVKYVLRARRAPRVRKRRCLLRNAHAVLQAQQAGKKASCFTPTMHSQKRAASRQNKRMHAAGICSGALHSQHVRTPPRYASPCRRSSSKWAHVQRAASSRRYERKCVACFSARTPESSARRLRRHGGGRYGMRKKKKRHAE